VFSQRGDGAWDVCDTVAFALEARTAAEVKQLTPSVWERLRDGVMTLVGMVVEAGTDDADDIARTGFDSTGVQGNTQADADADRAAAAAASPELAAAEAEEAEAAVTDDPLRCPPSAVVQSMPRRLVELHRRGVCGEEDVNAKRVWATLCCVALLETFTCCWLSTDGCGGRIIAPFLGLFSQCPHRLTRVAPPAGICTPRRSLPSWMRPTSGWLPTRLRAPRWPPRSRTASWRRRRVAPCGCGTARGTRA
jgi:hypothetical protein